MFGVHTMINRGHFILLLLQPPCLLWSPVMFRCILSSNCLTEWFRNLCSLFINDFGWSQSLCVCDKIAAQGKIRAFDSIKGSLYLIILQYYKCIYNWVFKEWSILLWLTNRNLAPVINIYMCVFWQPMPGLIWKFRDF